MNDDAVESICIRKNTIFLGTGSSGLYSYESGRVKKIVLEKESLNEANIKAIHKDDLSSIWISAYGEGVFEIKQNSSNGAFYVRSAITPERGLPSQYITSIFIDREGKVRKIHTGFNGPGTGEPYQRFVDEYTLFIEQLLREGDGEDVAVK